MKGGGRTSDKVYDRDRIFKAIVNHDAKDLAELKNYLYKSMKHLTNPEFTDPETGKTCLIKAMWYLKNGMNDTIPILLEAEEHDYVKKLVNSGYTNQYYKGQSALHVAIEKRSLKLVQLLIQHGADVSAKAEGTFFQRKKCRVSFYFGELPLSLAACTNQPNIVDYLLNNPYSNAEKCLKEADSHGNTVLHALVYVADNTDKNTQIITKMYDDILKKSIAIDPEMELEKITNNEALTPLKLAAKTGKIKLLEHILKREITEPDYKFLSRKFTEWTYGPVLTSLYDVSSLDSYEPNSVLEIIVFQSNANNRHEMILLEPLNHLLKEKWDSYAGKIFCMKLLFYMLYMIIFSVTAYHRPLEGQPPFPPEGTQKDNLRIFGEVIIMFGGLYILLSQIIYFVNRHPSFQILIMDEYFQIFFFLQAVAILTSGIMYLAGSEDYVALLVLGLVLGWVNMLYYTRAFQLTGTYSIMIQKTILRDMIRFLFVYLVFLFGFSTALVTLTGKAPKRAENITDAEPNEAGILYSDIYIATLELFKFTIGMGDLEFNENLKYKYFIMFLLLLYVILTYILLLNMLIALMSDTITEVAKESKSVWKLQKAAAILDIEMFLPNFLRTKLRTGEQLPMTLQPNRDPEERIVFRVEETQWESFGENLFCNNNEETDDNENAKMPDKPLTIKKRTLNKETEDQEPLQSGNPSSDSYV